MAPSGRDLGRFLKRSLGQATTVHVIFVPGMGSGKRHADQAYTLWQQLNVWFETWTTFGRGGQDFTSYVPETAPKLHPGGMPILSTAKKEELKDMVREKRSQGTPVVLLGFSAGAYMCLTVAQELEPEMSTGLAVFAMGHALYPAERLTICKVPGIIVMGEEECKWIPSGKPLHHERHNVVNNLADIQGGILPDEIGGDWGACAGGDAEPGHLSRCMPHCLVCVAGNAGHSVTGYAWALRRMQFRYVTGPAVPSARTTSSGSSLSYGSRTQLRANSV